MVDEYQDTNRPQYLLIRRLAEHHRNLCVVGDPDQSIYKWRGADLRNILDFEHDFPEADDRHARAQLPLDAGHPRRRVGGDQPEPQPQGQAPLDRPEGRRAVVYFRGNDELEEADFITRTVAAARCRGRPTAMAAVLYRTNAQSRAIEDALMREGIAYKIVGGVRFYERKEIKDALAYLRLDHQPARRCEPAPGDQRAGARHRQGRDGRARARSGPPADAAAAARRADSSRSRRRIRSGCSIERAIDERALAPRALASLTAFRDLIVALTEMAARRTRCRSPSARCSISPATCATCARSAARRPRRASRTSRSSSRPRANTKRAIRSRRSAGSSISCRCCRTPTRKQGTRDARVWLMTLHAAKGLEFPVVFMPGLEEGLFPHSRARDDEEELEEERRLCYVGMTARASGWC